MKILDNYKQDLIKSIRTPLLIELNKKDLEQFDGNGLNKAALYAEYIYNEFISNKESTNLIFIDSNNHIVHNKNEKQSIILLEEIIKLTSEQIQSYKNINIAKAGVKSALSYFTGPFIKELIGDYVDAGIDQVNDLLSEQFKNFIDVVEKELNYNFTDKILSKITSKINGTLNQSISNILEEVTNKKLNLSSKSINELSKLSSQFNENLTPVKIFSLILHLILLTAINEKDDQFNNKLIFINNPHKLDNESLAILSLLFSFSKDLKENNKHTGISVVYCYSDEEFQPYQELKDDKYKISKKLLDEQRRFTQRYAMLERPSSDIPNIAVKSSTFIGREKELQILKEQFKKSKEDSNLKNIEIIKAEPGIGKTKLVKKHIEQIKESEENGKRIIQLTILNQVGHSSSNTGLTSLKDSILNEAKRLETLKLFEETVVDNLKKMVKSKAISYIENLIGVNNIIEIGTSVKDAYDLKNNTNTMLEESTKGINNKDKKTKEQQFEEIIEAILELKVLAYEGKAIKPLPIILFIDDIQWIDDESSEFILNYLIKYENLNIHIIATQRTSDATTALKNAQKEPILNQFKISFLQQVGITTENIIDIERVTKLAVNTIELNGLNKENLTELISLTIDSENKNENKKQKDKILAQFIIKNLVNENSEDKEYVNTLFAIETINMLCDEKLYSSNINITEQFILQNPLRYNESVKEFLKVLEDTFKILNNKYNDAFEHINSDKRFEQQFNLMAYAVLEERLYILHEYFREYGNAAVNTLLFSSLLGAPFNSEIVKNILFELSKTEEKLLQPLKNYINESQQCNLNEVHYEIIEEVYEILSRYIHFDSTYSYKHNLLEIFLEKQLEYILDSKFEEEKIIEAKDKLFELIINEIKNLETRQRYYKSKVRSLNLIDNEIMTFFKKKYKNIFYKAYSNNPDKWAKQYILSLNELAILLKENNLIPVFEVHSLFEESLKIVKKYYINNNHEWIENYIEILNQFENLYMDLELIENIFFTAKESLIAIEKQYKKSPELWADKYVKRLDSLSYNCKITENIEEAISFSKKSLIIAKEFYLKNPKNWLNKYLNSLHNLEMLLKDYFGHTKDTIILSRERLNILRELYKKNSEKWSDEYISNINGLAYSFKQLREYKEMELLEKESLNVLKDLYIKNSDNWEDRYKLILKRFVEYLEERKNEEEIFILENDFLEATKILYIQNPKQWHNKYLISINKLANMCIKNENFKKASNYFEEYFKVYDGSLNDNITYFIYPFIKWYLLEENNKNQIKELNKIAGELIVFYKNKLKSNYTNIIEEEYLGYRNLLNEADNKINQKKLIVFEKIFMEKKIND